MTTSWTKTILEATIACTSHLEELRILTPYIFKCYNNYERWDSKGYLSIDVLHICTSIYQRRPLLTTTKRSWETDEISWGWTDASSRRSLSRVSILFWAGIQFGKVRGLATVLQSRSFIGQSKILYRWFRMSKCLSSFTNPFSLKSSTYPFHACGNIPLQRKSLSFASFVSLTSNSLDLLCFLDSHEMKVFACFYKVRSKYLHNHSAPDSWRNLRIDTFSVSFVDQ